MYFEVATLMYKKTYDERANRIGTEQCELQIYTAKTKQAKHRLIEIDLKRVLQLYTHVLSFVCSKILGTFTNILIGWFTSIVILCEIVIFIYLTLSYPLRFMVHKVLKRCYLIRFLKDFKILIGWSKLTVFQGRSLFGGGGGGLYHPPINL